MMKTALIAIVALIAFDCVCTAQDSKARQFWAAARPAPASYWVVTETSGGRGDRTGARSVGGFSEEARSESRPLDAPPVYHYANPPVYYYSPPRVYYGGNCVGGR